jgi:Cdc6-like AAA superfamily ATPase
VKSSLPVTSTGTSSFFGPERNFTNIVNLFQRLLVTEPATKVIVIVDEFDIFVQQQRQSFIYSLLECMNIKPQNLSIIAISSRLVSLLLFGSSFKSQSLFTL